MESTTMRVTGNGQVSLPAGLRRRWNADAVLVIDRGDYAVVRPIPRDIVGSLRGAYAGLGPTSDELRAQERQVDAEIEDRRAR